jgi:3-deoxy-manno-octulosonate cytidylyltransferase (CMP-KDO synthetase)
MSSVLKDWLVVVPARLASQRLPEKPLADLGGKPLVVRTVENLAPLARAGAAIVVATDAKKVADACKSAGLAVEMTRAEHPSGTDRCWEVASRHPQQLIMNVQGDEPFAATDDLLSLAAEFAGRKDAAIGTLVFKATDRDLAQDPNAVKAVGTTDGWALYFSRASIPYDREAGHHLPAAFWHHMGVYAFRRAQLEAFVKLPPSPLEQTEKLEQLRALENGWRILLHPARAYSRGIYTPHDLEAARARF